MSANPRVSNSYASNNPDYQVHAKDSANGVVQYFLEDGLDSSSVTSVVASASNVTLIASSTSVVVRKFFNDCDKACYLKEGATATTSSFTIKIFPNGYYETKFRGQIDALWDAGPTGSMRITELS